MVQFFSGVLVPICFRVSIAVIKYDDSVVEGMGLFHISTSQSIFEGVQGRNWSAA